MMSWWDERSETQGTFAKTSSYKRLLPWWFSRSTSRTWEWPLAHGSHSASTYRAYFLRLWSRCTPVWVCGGSLSCWPSNQTEAKRPADQCWKRKQSSRKRKCPSSCQSIKPTLRLKRSTLKQLGGKKYSYNLQERPHGRNGDGEADGGEEHANVADFDWEEAILVGLLGLLRRNGPSESLCSKRHTKPSSRYRVQK